MKKLLIIDDDQKICRLLKHHLRRADYQVDISNSGDQGIKLARNTNPDLILLDINMPESNLNGLDTLRLIRKYETTASTPVIMITARNDLPTVKKAVQMEANGYVIKPFQKEHLLQNISKYVNRRVELQWSDLQPEQETVLTETLRAMDKVSKWIERDKGKNPFEDIKKVSSKIVESLGNEDILDILSSLKDHSSEVFSHSLSTSVYLLLFARHLNQDKIIFTPQDLQDLALGGLLHDLGKLRIPLSILQKREVEMLSPSENAEFQRHVEYVGPILQAIPGISILATEIAMKHHEKWDGSGYPKGLSGGMIGIPALMTSIVDTYEYLTSNRNANHMTSQAALQELQSHKSWYDEGLLGQFTKLIQNSTSNQQRKEVLCGELS